MLTTCTTKLYVYFTIKFYYKQTKHLNVTEEGVLQPWVLQVLYSACNRWWQDNLLILLGLKLRSFVHVFNAIWGFFFKICEEKNPYARLHYDYVSTFRNAFTQWTFIYTVQRLIRYWDPVPLDRDYSFAPVTPINIHTCVKAFKCTAVFLKTYWMLICWHTGKTWYSSKLFYFFQHGYNSLNLQ